MKCVAYDATCINPNYCSVRSNMGISPTCCAGDMDCKPRNTMQIAVERFHEKLGHPISHVPVPMPRPELRAKLIEEEAKETADAIRAGNFIEAVDGMCDLLYVVFGTAVECGIDLQPFFDEVHRTNMLKEGGGFREDGKTLKPPGWEPPRIAQMIRELFAEAEKSR